MHLATHARHVRYSIDSCPRVVDKLRLLPFFYGGTPVISRLARRATFRFRSGGNGADLRVQLRNPSDFIIYREVFDFGAYAAALPMVPSTILDIGANVGFASLYLHRRFPGAAITAVEPVPGNVRQMRANFALNAVPAHIVEAAVDTRDGALRMELADMDCGHRVADGGTPESARTIDVAALSVPSLMRMRGWQTVDLLKLDVEGHEAVLLKSACNWLDHVRMLYVECHGSFGERDLREVASRHGFAMPTRPHEHTWLLARP